MLSWIIIIGNYPKDFIIQKKEEITCYSRNMSLKKDRENE